MSGIFCFINYKKNVFCKIIALVLVITTLTCVLASCGGLSGKYSGEIDLFLAKYKVTYTTDTRPTVSIRENAKNSDLFICEGMYGEKDKIAKAKESAAN